VSRRGAPGPEEALQRDVVSFLLYVEPLCQWTHVSNQRGTRKRFEMGVLKAMGVKAGWADLTFLLPGPPWRGKIELKAPKGRLSLAQVRDALECNALEIPWRTCRTVLEVDTVLREWGVTYAREPSGFFLQRGDDAGGIDEPGNRPAG
jgi:hypothetical protein